MSKPIRLLLASCLVLTTFPVLAAEGRIQIPFAAPVMTPIVITAPGSYVLTRNLAPTGTGPIIRIQTGAAPGDVHIELNGMILDNRVNSSDPVIEVTAGSETQVTIRNGSLIGGSSGIEVDYGPPQARKIVVEDVEISGFTGSGASAAGIMIQGAENFALRRNVIINTDTAAGPGGAGIYIEGGDSSQGIIEDNLIQRTLDGIVVLPTVSVKIINNQLLEILSGGFYGVGISVNIGHACVVSHNRVETLFAPPPAKGIHLGYSMGCRISHNVVRNVAAEGILVDSSSHDNLILENVVTGAGGDGLFVGGDRNLVELNMLNSNGGSGLRFGPDSSDNTFRRNSATGNAGSNCAFSFPPPHPTGFCDDAGPPLTINYSSGDNLMPASYGAF